MGYKTKSMIYAKSKEGFQTSFDVRLSDGITGKFEGKPFVKSEKEKKEPGAYSQGAKLLDETSQNDVVLSGLTSQDWGTRLGTSLGIMVNKIRKNKKQKNLSEGKGKGKGRGTTGGPSSKPLNNNISIPIKENEEDQQFSSMSDSYIKTKIATEKAKSYLGSFGKKSIPTSKDKTKRLDIDVVTPIKPKPVSPFVNPTENIGIVPRKEKTKKELKQHFKKNEGINKKINKKIDNQESKYSADFSKFSTKEFPEQITAVGLGQDLTKTLYLNNAKKQGFTRDQAMRNVNVTQQTDGYRAYKYEMSGGKNPAFYEETPKKRSLFGRKKNNKKIDK